MFTHHVCFWLKPAQTGTQLVAELAASLFRVSPFRASG
jgi:hypothetical protein